MKVGRDTVWRVQRWLDDQTKGYEHAVKKLEYEIEKRHFKRIKRTGSFLDFIAGKY